MHIKEISIYNFRNLSNVSVTLDKNINYIVGDNNIGKSNLLILLDKLFNKSFQEQDYFNKLENIIIRLVISLDKNDYKLFDEKISVYPDSTIHLKIKQGIFDSYMTVIDSYNGRHIDFHYLKRILFDSFNSGLELNSKISENVLDELYKIDREELSIDSKRYENKTYLTMASIYLYNTIYNNVIDGYFKKSEITINEGKTIKLPLIIALDEPELHLNPYLQRTLIGYYKKLLSNKCEKFNKIIKRDFGIDSLLGDLIVVTHSTDALVDDYRSIIRFYKKRDTNYCICGSNLKLRENVSKHLSMMFSDIKEAFFANKVILVEGITEYGAFKGFSNTMGIDLDKHGICLINANGEGSISRIKELLDNFKIPTICVYDGDVKDKKVKYRNEIFTKEVCFEMEIVSSLIDSGNYDLLESIAKELPLYNTQMIDSLFVKKAFEKIGIDDNIKPQRLSNLKRDDKLYKPIYFAWFYKKKGLYLGRIVGSSLREEDIPASYKNAIRFCVS